MTTSDPRIDPEHFAASLLAWFDDHGRRDLPWQENRDPYRIWVAEIMLQQTRVATVVDYFRRFLDRFPTLADLAEADDDAVLSRWSGLGYYSRARHLKRAAELCVEHHEARLPEDFDALLALPGIGRSTAGAILAQAHGQRHPILDGNVKRVLARLHGIDQWPGKSAVARRLWEIAAKLTAKRRVADYTQAIMDLGALVCTPRKPACGGCPVAAVCIARAEDRVEACPGRKPKRELPERHRYALWQVDEEGRVLLERRPEAGIWGRLYAPPLVEELDLAHRGLVRAAPIRHGFTHFRLTLTPVRIEVDSQVSIMDREARWAGRADLDDLGLPRPIERLLKRHFEDRLTWQEQCIA